MYAYRLALMDADLDSNMLNFHNDVISQSDCYRFQYKCSAYLHCFGDTELLCFLQLKDGCTKINVSLINIPGNKNGYNIR